MSMPQIAASIEYNRVTQKVAARRRLIEHIDDILRRPQPVETSRP